MRSRTGSIAPTLAGLSPFVAILGRGHLESSPRNNHFALRALGLLFKYLPSLPMSFGSSSDTLTAESLLNRRGGTKHLA